MTGLDTNVLVRYLAQEQPGFVSHVVLAETAWMLESCYGADAAKISQVVETLLRTEGLVVAQTAIVWQALRQYRQNAGDFADTLIAQLTRQAGCTRVLTFDKRAAKRSGMTLLS